MTDLAVVLAAGRGSRLQRASVPLKADSRTSDATPTPATASGPDRLAAVQEAAATAGIKALIPVGSAGSERPIIDYILASLADAGIREVCLVVNAASESAFAAHFQHTSIERLVIRYAHQDQPRGTADAVLAARQTIGARPFLVLGCDTWMPAEVLRRVVRYDGCAMPAFARARLLAADTNLDDEKVRGFAVLDLSAADRHGSRRLERVREKPDQPTWAALEEPVFLSLNAWRFESPILDACAAVAPSPRGEFELPDAVQLLIERGVPVAALTTESPALDLTYRADARSFGRLIGDRPVAL